MMTIPHYARRIGHALFEELLQMLLEECAHIALLGPRQGGKSLALEEVILRVGELPEETRPYIISLTDDALKKLSQDSFVVEMAVRLGVDSTPNWREDTPLSGKLEALLRAAIKKDAQPVWIFVRDILGFSAPIARELLYTFQLCSEDSILRNRIGVVVTGSADFIPLTYGEVSPYRHAKKYVVYGLEKEFAAKFYQARRMRQRCRERACALGGDIGQEIAEDAFQYLYEQTGGDPHLLQEIVVTACRHPYTLKDIQLSDTWTLDETRLCIENFQSLFMPSDFYCRMTIREVEHRNDAFDLLLQVLHKGDGNVLIPGAGPHALEVCGLIRRDTSGKARIGSPIWRSFLEEELKDQLVADAYAWQHRWEKVWEHYQGLSVAQRDRPVSDRATYRLRSVLSAWDDSVMDQVGNGPEAVWKQFAPGAHYLLGFNAGSLLNAEGLLKKPLHPREPLGAGDFYAPGTTEPPSHRSVVGANTRDYWLDPERLRLYSSPNITLRWPPGVKPALFLQRRGCGRAVDSAEQKRIWRSLDSFWQAYETACEIRYEKEIGKLRQKHLEVIDKVNRYLTQDPFDMGEVVKAAADALVDKAGYYRVLICLVGPQQKRIQGVASKCQDPEFNFDKQTDFSLEGDKEDIEDWDIQPWVVEKRRMESLKDGKDPSQRNPKSNVDQAIELDMRAVTVVPMMVAEEVIGTIHFERHDKDEPSAAEKDLFTTFAGQLGVIFHQAKRMTLLQESMAVLKDKMRIVDPSRRVLFFNKAAAADYPERSPGWQAKPWSCECLRSEQESCYMGEIPEEGGTVQRYHMDTSGVESQPSEWLMTSIDDFRSTLEAPFKASGRIGYIERVHDLRALYDLVKAFQTWLEAPGLHRTAQSILSFFQRQGFDWCRIYLRKESDDGKIFLESLEEYGMKEEKNKARFLHGKIRFAKDHSDPLPWYVIDESRDLSIYEFSEEQSVGEISQVGDYMGLPLYYVREVQYRDELEKDDSRWLEAPLSMGGRTIGKIAFAMHEDLSPLKWELLRNALTGAAAAIDEALSAETAASKAEAVWKNASNQAVHQLTNKLVPLESFAHYAGNAVGKDLGKCSENIKRVEVGLREAREILGDFKRYASDKPFEDTRFMTLAELLDLAQERVRLRHADVEPVVSPACEKLLIEMSPKALIEAFDILADNSLKHGGEVTQIRLEASLPATASGTVRIAYCDNGKGIGESDKESVFRPYHTSDPQGTGLGLSIARRYVELHGGKMTEEGKAGEGVCFTMCFNITQRKGEEN